MLLGGWFWMTLDGFECFQLVLDGFRWLSEICSLSSYGEIRCFKSRRSGQLWEVFVVSGNNDTKAPLKQMTSFWVIQNIKFHFKRPWVGKRMFIFAKIDIYSFM